MQTKLKVFKNINSKEFSHVIYNFEIARSPRKCTNPNCKKITNRGEFHLRLLLKAKKIGECGGGEIGYGEFCSFKCMTLKFKEIQLFIDECEGYHGS